MPPRAPPPPAPTSGPRGCLLALLNLIVPDAAPRGPTGPPPFTARASLLTPGEAAFHDTLRRSLGAHIAICPKVRLIDAVELPDGAPNRLSWFNRAAAKHIDFLLADSQSLRPLVAIELDDRSHDSAHAARRDRAKDEICSAAGLPLVRIPAARTYNPTQLLAKLGEHLPGWLPGTAAPPPPRPG